MFSTATLGSLRPLFLTCATIFLDWTASVMILFASRSDGIGVLFKEFYYCKSGALRII